MAVAILDVSPDLLPFGSSPLHVLANSSDVKSLTLFIHSLPDVSSSIDALDRCGRTPLVVALQNGRFGAARILIESGANLDVVFDRGLNGGSQTVSQALSHFPYLQFLKSLISDNVKLSLDSSLLCFLLHSAAFEGKESFLILLLEQYEVDVDSKDNLGRTALHYSAQTSDIRCVEVLVRFGANTRLTDSQGRTPLHIACALGHQNVVEFFLQDWVTPDPNIPLSVQDHKGRTPLHTCLYHKQFDLFSFLINLHRFSLDLSLSDDAGYTLPQLVFFHRFKMNLGRFLGNSLILSSEEATWLLHESVWKLDIDSVIASIGHGALVNCFDLMQQTPLILASKLGSLSIFTCLAENGASPNLSDMSGCTPLYYTCKEGHHEVVSYLLSLPDIDLSLFYERYNHSLTTGVVYALLGYFAKCPPDKKPNNWCKWITLAACNPNMSRDAFSSLVDEICPNSWLRLLADRDIPLHKKSSTIAHTSVKAQILPIMITDLSVKEKEQKRNELRFISIQEARRVAPPFSCTKPSPPVTSFLHLKTVKNATAWSRRQPFHVESVGYFPLHVAVMNKSTEVFRFILSKAADTNPSLVEKLLGARDTSGHTVLEYLGRNFQSFKSVLEELNITEFVRTQLVKLYQLPEGVKYEMALLHYLVSGGPQSVQHVANGRKSKTPLDQWPQWYVHFMLTESSQDFSQYADAYLLHSQEDCKQLAIRLLMTSENLPLDESLGKYACLLYAAVVNGCMWGVEILLQNGASPVAEYRERYAIVEAVKHGQNEILEGFLGCVAQDQLNEHVCTALLPALVSLANLGYVRMVGKLLSKCNSISSLWLSPKGPRLLYTLVMSNDTQQSLPIIVDLVNDAASFLCLVVLDLWDLNVSHAKFRSLLKFHQIYLPYVSRINDPCVQAYVHFVRFCCNLPYFDRDLLFHRLCGLGEYELVKFVLRYIGDSHVHTVVNKLDLAKRSPLFYAACGGHQEIVELLVSIGSSTYTEQQEPPIIGLLLYLAQSPNTNCVGDLFMSSRFTTHAVRLKHYKQFNRQLPSYYEFNSETFKSQQKIAQLADVLLPTPDCFESMLKVHSFHLITLLSTIRNIDPFKELLLHILSAMESCTFVFKNEDLSELRLFQNCYNELRADGPPRISVADIAVTLVPYFSVTSPDVKDLHDRVLVMYADNNLQLVETVSIAAKKGYWGLVMSSLPVILNVTTRKTTFQEHAMHSTDPQDNLVKICIEAVVAGQKEILDTAFTHVLKPSAPITAFVKHNQLNTVELLVNDAEGLVTALNAAVKYSSADIFTSLLGDLATLEPDMLTKVLDSLVKQCVRYANEVLLNSLLTLYQDVNLTINSAFGDRTLSFWVLVLYHSAKFGNQQICLQAVRHIPKEEIGRVKHHYHYASILSGCCYWGMVDLLQHLPFTSRELFERRSPEVSCPWEDAVANGHVGRFSLLPGFPSLSEAVTQLPHNGPLMVEPLQGTENPTSFRISYLFCGVFKKLVCVQCTSSEYYGISTNILFNRHKKWFTNSSAVAILFSAITHGLTNIVKVFIDHLGNYAGEVIDLLPSTSDVKIPMSLLHAACHEQSKVDNYEVLQLLVQALRKCNLLAKHLNQETKPSVSLFHDCLTSTVFKGSVKCMRLLLQCIESKEVSYRLSNGDVLLYLAVLSKSAEMVDVVLNLLGEDAAMSCFVKNIYDETPFSLAFQLGCMNVIHNSSLLKIARKHPKFSELETDWYPHALCARGWFHSMMLHNSASSTHTDSECSLRVLMPNHVVNIRKSVDVWKFLYSASKYGLHKVAEIVLSVSTYEALCLCSLPPPYLFESVVLLPALKRFGINTELFTRTLITAVEKFNKELNNDNAIVQAFELISFEDNDSSLIKATFQSACALNKLQVVKYLLQRSNQEVIFQLVLVQDKDTLRQGLVQAITHGSFDTAAYLQLEYDLPFEERLLSDGVQLSDLIHQIFACKTYYQVLENLFQSTADSANSSGHEKFPLAAAWLSHSWTEKEAMLVMRKVGGTSGTNPWRMSFSSQYGTMDILLHVDWDSFSECLLHSPHVDSPSSKYRYTPLLTEATVFSSAILGEILQTTHINRTNPKAFSSPSNSFDLAALAGSSNLSSVILSCSTWPTKPSFVSMNSGEQGVLSLSYLPSEGVFLFPSTSATGANESDASLSGIDDSGIHFSFETSMKVDSVDEEHADIAQYYSARIKKALDKKVKASITFDDNILDEETFNSVYFYLWSCLDDCTSALALVMKPAVRYSSLTSHVNSVGLKNLVQSRRKIKMPCSKVKINFNLSQHQHVTTTCDNEILNICVNFAFENSEEYGQIVSSPPFDVLLESITTCILAAEVEKDKGNFEKAVAVKLLPQLKKSLKMGGTLDPDLISLAVKDEVESAHKISKLTTEHLVHVKSLAELKHFLYILFCTLHVLSYKPKLHTSVRNMFEAGFKIYLTSSNDTYYTVKAGVPELTISSLALLNRSYSNLLLGVLRSLVEKSSHQRQLLSLKDVASQIPAPSASHIDLERSKGLLYPTKNTKGTIMIQLVDYNGQNLSAKPTVNCVVDITLVSPTSNRVSLMYRDDECVVASTSDKQVIVHLTPSGEIHIDWTPQEAGLYSLFVSLNSISIKGSPFKSWCVESNRLKSVGTRKSSAGCELIFIAEHNNLNPHCNYHSTCDPAVHLHKRSSIKPLCLAIHDITDLNSDLSKSVTSHSCFTKSLEDELLQAERDMGIHHISLSSNFGGPRQWFNFAAHPVAVHISPDYSYKRQLSKNKKSKVKEARSCFEIHCNPLSNGMFSVVLTSTMACTFKMFVSCPICQSVMKIHWVDQTSVLPSICYNLPGLFSPKHSSIKFTMPHRKSKYFSGWKRTVTAGSVVSFAIKVRDAYGNSHTSGGAVKAVSIRGAGRRHLAPDMQRHEFIQALMRPADDVKCRVDDKGNGEYAMDGQVFASGVHDIVVFDLFSQPHVMGSIKVVSGPACAPHCELPMFNEYEAGVSQRYICELELYDEYWNECDTPNAYTQVNASVDGIQLSVTSGVNAVNRRLIGITRSNTIVLHFVPDSTGKKDLLIHINGVLLPACPIKLNIVHFAVAFVKRYKVLMTQLRARWCNGYTPTLTINRSDILESSLRVFSAGKIHFNKVVRVRFGEELGIDTGGVSREFFHLLCLEFVNPQYALFHCVNGLYKPSANSSVNVSHLLYFEFFGKVLAKCICDGHQVVVRFTPAVYKYLLGKECTLDDLKIEDPSLHKGLFEIMDSQSEEDLEQLADNFTAVRSHFGALHTVELEQGGESRKVTMANRHDFVHKLFNWHLLGCIGQQLSSMKHGFNSLIFSGQLDSFSAHELEVILSGQPTIDIAFIKERTVYSGYSERSQEIKWMWEVLENFTQEQRCQFLQFTTGCACLPTADMGQWKFKVQRGASDPALLPQAATCFNSITLPVYQSKDTLRGKLEIAISYGQQAFLVH